MTGHLVFTAWDAENPATLSPTVIRDVIRGAIGFDGLLLTDDIDMEALGGTIPERAARAHAAGCDIILNCWAKMDDMQGICAVLPTMSEATATRLERALAGTRIAPAIAPEAAALLAKRDALLALAGAAA
jgi:beta-N-acetylhexosaminidase